jgi:hypothetical protein
MTYIELYNDRFRDLLSKENDPSASPSFSGCLPGGVLLTHGHG